MTPCPLFALPHAWRSCAGTAHPTAAPSGGATPAPKVQPLLMETSSGVFFLEAGFGPVPGADLCPVHTAQSHSEWHIGRRGASRMRASPVRAIMSTPLRRLLRQPQRPCPESLEAGSAGSLMAALGLWDASPFICWDPAGRSTRGLDWGRWGRRRKQPSDSFRSG